MHSDGALACWGDGQRGQTAPPTGDFVQVSAGGSHACGVRDDGTAACWGSDDDNQAPVVSLVPRSVSDGKRWTIYTQRFILSCGTPPFTFAVSAGAPPPTMILTMQGTLSGTLMTPGIYAFTVTAIDGYLMRDQQSYAITVRGNLYLPSTIRDLE